MTYTVKEIFYTLQGEGANAGRAAVFCRFAGCNLWSGRVEDRAQAVCCFCDTDFVGTDGENGGKYANVASLVEKIASLWPQEETQEAPQDGRRKTQQTRRFVVCTGGEPMLQMDAPLIDALHAAGFSIAIETNGTLPVPDTIDWVCVSPKAGAPLLITQGSELKVVVPQHNQHLADYAELDFAHFFVQPLDGPTHEANTKLAIDWCKRHPQWRLSIQAHKYLNIP